MLRVDAPGLVLPLDDPRAGARRPLQLAVVALAAIAWIAMSGGVVAYVVGGLGLIGIVVSLVTWSSGRRAWSGHGALGVTSSGLSCPLWTVDFDDIRDISIGRYAVLGLTLGGRCLKIDATNVRWASWGLRIFVGTANEMFGQPPIVMGERVFDRPLEEVLAAISTARSPFGH